MLIVVVKHMLINNTNNISRRKSDGNVVVTFTELLHDNTLDASKFQVLIYDSVNNVYDPVDKAAAVAAAGTITSATITDGKLVLNVTAVVATDAKLVI